MLSLHSQLWGSAGAAPFLSGHGSKTGEISKNYNRNVENCGKQQLELLYSFQVVPKCVLLKY